MMRWYTLLTYNKIKDITHMYRRWFLKILGDVKVIKIVVLKKNNDDDHHLPRSEAKRGTIVQKKFIINLLQYFISFVHGLLWCYDHREQRAVFLLLII